MFLLAHSQRSHSVISFYIFSEMVNLPKLDAPSINPLDVG
ncbi:hypothetical protein COO91_10042 (plasmid) [Nostoc flagelliforme CCNUN1]|uniref:Uncharacterized protein n=1 Tax=Nostoc flagelliforme CCNUN1 TaxID=2038116 RepID=A0A2K8T9X0_9NOSO|nr:hypothetical protein COO91_10042 [Nostoc flagelliforme CCNUN1]